MGLDDFLAKKAKKKVKKKQNPQDLIEKLTNEKKATSATLESDVAPDPNNKPLNNEEEDEWEAVDDYEEIDLHNISIGKLSTVESEDPGNLSSKNKDVRENVGEVNEEKKVWASKALENKAEVPAPEESPEKPTNSGLYIPAPLRNVSKVTKPDVGSADDFPTLDAANETLTKKVEQQEVQPDDSTWQQTGTRRSNRTTDLPVSTQSNSAYVPPSLRQTTNESGFSRVSSFQSGSNYESRGFRPREDTFRNEGESWIRRHDFDNPYTRDTVNTSGSWQRGQTINKNPFESQLVVDIPPSQVGSENPASNSGWSQNVNMKTYRETTREKPNFELVQTNRFAGLSET